MKLGAVSCLLMFVLLNVGCSAGDSWDNMDAVCVCVCVDMCVCRLSSSSSASLKDLTLLLLAGRTHTDDMEG